MGRGEYIANQTMQLIKVIDSVCCGICHYSVAFSFNRSVGMRPVTASTAWATPMVAMSRLGLVTEWVGIRYRQMSEQQYFFALSVFRACFWSHFNFAFLQLFRINEANQLMQYDQCLTKGVDGTAVIITHCNLNEHTEWRYFKVCHDRYQASFEMQSGSLINKTTIFTTNQLCWLHQNILEYF